jgi:hypothetical protein
VQLAEKAPAGGGVDVPSMWAVKFLRRSERASVHVVARELLNQRMCALHPHIIQLREIFVVQVGGPWLGLADRQIGRHLAPVSST